MSDLEPSGALKAIMEDHRAKLAAVEASRDLISQALNAIGPVLVPPPQAATAAPDSTTQVVGPTSTTTTTQTVKPGWKTSEFWMTLAVPIIAAVSNSLGYHDAAATTGKGGVLVLIAYIINRALTKWGAK